MKRVRLTDEQKRANKLAKKAASLTAASAKANGPLFAHLADTYTPADAERHAARVRANMIEHLHTTMAGPGSRALDFVRLGWIERTARELVGPHFEPLAAHVRKIFGSSVGSYGYGFWRGVLCDSEEVVYEYRRRAEGETGPIVVPSRSCKLTPPPMTRTEFHERFPYTEPTHFAEGETPEGEELFRRVMTALGVPS